MGQRSALSVEGETIAVSNLDKVLYPSGFTKAQVIDYYIRVSRILLPHLQARPVTLKRYPDGVRGEHFYEKDAPGFTPEWVETFRVPRRGRGGEIRYILINNLKTLVWCANLANLEIHPFLHRAPEIERPTSIVFDLDPGEGADVLTCAEVAFLLRDVLSRLKLRCYAKVSGSKGMQLALPLNTQTSYAVTQPFARTLAELLAREHPHLAVAEMAKALRGGKVFIDWSQNSDYKTTVGAYSLRAKRDEPYVSLPVTWEELKKARRVDQLYFEPEAALARLEKNGDLFASVLEERQTVPETFEAEAARWARTRPKALEEYAKKRDFTRTAEPAAGERPRRAQQGSRRRFVVQKHAASHLHYDFRLEMHGVLKSWAVPKGVPYKPEDKRLAMATEDHPLDYLDFEGTIPEGQYGGGTVMVWDIGTYEIVEGNYYQGTLRVFLEGKKLLGEWTLRRDEGKNWFLEKSGEAARAPAKKKENASALTGRTIEEIAEAGDRVWQSNRGREAEPALDKLPDTELQFVAPMRALALAKLPEGRGWLYEIKFDGYRTLARKKSGRVTLWSRNERELNERFPSIAEACRCLEEGTLIDGEVVALDERGRPSFNLLQQHRKTDLVYYVFDVLAWRGKSLTKRPLAERREFLKRALAGCGGPVRISEALDAPVNELIRAAREQGLEGLVAKDGASVYEPGERRGQWVKLKLNQGQELVIGGYKPGKDGFDCLLVGYYEGGKLIFNGKIKNGFVPGVKQEVMARFKGLGTERCPFANLPEPKNARRGEALTAQVMKRCCWLKPVLVAQIEYTDWTEANHLRHSRFAGLREDKEAREVVREVAE
jgi:bifunctional non-homologous end joining protein LigD